MKYLEGLNKVIEAMGKRELDQNAQQTTYLGLIVMQLATIADELARMNDNNERDNLPVPSVGLSYKPNIDEMY